MSVLGDKLDDGVVNQPVMNHIASGARTAATGGIMIASGGSSLIVTVAATSAMDTVGSLAEQNIKTGKMDIRQALTEGLTTGLTAGAVSMMANAIASRLPSLLDDDLISLYGSVSNKGGVDALKSKWYKGTFDNVDESIEYHLSKHGKGRTLKQYTDDAMDFFSKNKKLGTEITLKDGTKGIKIQTGTGKNKIGGYWTNDGKLVTFWD